MTLETWQLVPDWPTPLLVVVGLALLLLGRRLFWLLVALVGAGAAYWLVAQVADPATGSTALIVAVLAGIAGAVLAVVLQRLAIALAGFLAGAGLATWALDAGVFGLSYPEGVLPLVAILLIAGILGAILAARLFDGALIFLSALVGAMFLVAPMPLDGTASTLVLAGLTFVGIAAQLGRGRGRRERRREEAR